MTSVADLQNALKSVAYSMNANDMKPFMLEKCTPPYQIYIAYDNNTQTNFFSFRSTIVRQVLNVSERLCGKS